MVAGLNLSGMFRLIWSCRDVLSEVGPKALQIGLSYRVFELKFDYSERTKLNRLKNFVIVSQDLTRIPIQAEVYIIE